MLNSWDEYDPWTSVNIMMKTLGELQVFSVLGVDTFRLKMKKWILSDLIKDLMATKTVDKFENLIISFDFNLILSLLIALE